MLSKINSAFEKGHIWPAFQPIVDIRSGGLRGFEVLARWSDPHLSNIGPANFIPVLEEHDLIDRLFSHLVHTCGRVTASWPGTFFLAFNLSPKQLHQPDLPQELIDVVYGSGFPLNRVQVEITESSLFADGDRAYANLRDLDAAGVKVAIDDFGTGYSSLARLESFPFRKLKIDARFVRSLDRDVSKRRIAAAIIGLGQSLGITVVAEGVETREEEDALRSLGCDLGQGWLYGKPGPALQARRLLEILPSGIERARPLDGSPFQQLHQLGTLYKQAPVGLCFLDLEYRHVRANDRFASMYNMSGVELEGKTIDEIMCGSTLSAVKQKLRHTAASDVPVIATFLKGDRHYHIFCSRVLELGGEIIGFSVVSVETQTPSELCRSLMAEARLIGSDAPAPITICPGCGPGSQYHSNDVRYVSNIGFDAVGNRSFGD